MIKEYDGVVVYPNFIDSAALDTFISELSMLERYGVEGHAYDRYVQTGESEVLFPLMEDLNIRIKDFIEDYYSCKVGVEELASVVCALEGWDLSLHADSYQEKSMNLSTYAGYPSRDISTLVYFSNYGEDFTGGYLFLPNQDLFFYPKAGTLVTFPTSEKYLHQVSRVNSGERLNITTFWHVLERFDSTRYV
jgi:hypothetical protein